MAGNKVDGGNEREPNWKVVYPQTKTLHWKTWQMLRGAERSCTFLGGLLLWAMTFTQHVDIFVLQDACWFRYSVMGTSGHSYMEVVEGILFFFYYCDMINNTLHLEIVFVLI